MIFETMTFLSIYQHNLKNIRHSEKSQVHGLEKYNTNSFTAKLKYICDTLSNYQSSQKKTHQSDLELGQSEPSDFSRVYDAQVHSATFPSVDKSIQTSVIGNTCNI